MRLSAHSAWVPKNRASLLDVVTASQVPVIGMIYQNGDRPVNLFEKHNAHQPVGPGHFT